MACYNVLIVDDDINILRLLESSLSKSGYNVFKSTSGEEALKMLESKPVHAVVLDVILPGIDGLETLKRIKSHPVYKDIPVLMLTCRDSEIDNVVGLELGADDYIGKPLRYHELTARIKAVLRRTAHSYSAYSQKISAGSLEIDLPTRTAVLSGCKLQLSYKEFELLCLLAKNPGKVFLRDEILNSLWSEDAYIESRTIDVHIRRIRKKFEEAGQSGVFIETVRNVGYRLVSPP